MVFCPKRFTWWKNQTKKKATTMTSNTTLAELVNPEKKGFLMKASLHLKIFKKRWMVLKDDKLYSFKTNKSFEKATEVFDLSMYNNIDLKFEHDKSFLSSSCNNRSRIFLEPTQPWTSLFVSNGGICPALQMV